MKREITRSLDYLMAYTMVKGSIKADRNRTNVEENCAQSTSNFWSEQWTTTRTWTNGNEL